MGEGGGVTFFVVEADGLRDSPINPISSLPSTNCLSAMVILAHHGEVAKALPVVRLATHKLLVSIDAFVGVELLATTLADKEHGQCVAKSCAG